MERFWSKVDKSGECWTWTAAKNKKGYGIFGMDRTSRLSHKVSYEMSEGPVPEGMELDHTCWNRACVRPSHMRLVGRLENVQNRNGANRTSKSGIRGVHQHPGGRWVAQARVPGTNGYIGLFDSPAEAEAAVVKFRRENMPNSLMDQEKAAWPWT